MTDLTEIARHETRHPTSGEVLRVIAVYLDDETSVYHVVRHDCGSNQTRSPDGTTFAAPCWSTAAVRYASVRYASRGQALNRFRRLTRGAWAGE